MIERGYEGATTGRIAERAGVSIGSLYQYFPNKEALVAALIEGHANEIVRVIEAALDDPAPATVADGIRALIKAGMVAHRIDPALHKILNEQVPRVGRLAKAMDTSRRITKAIERFLRAHADELDPGCDPPVAAVVVETTVEALAHKALAERRAMLTNCRLERETFRLADDAHDQWQVVTGLDAPAGSRSGKLDQRGDGRPQLAQRRLGGGDQLAIELALLVLTATVFDGARPFLGQAPAVAPPDPRRTPATSAPAQQPAHDPHRIPQ